MGTHKKQHLISQTYLKHFSINGDGTCLFAIDKENQFKKGIQSVNSGDSIFWEKNYSDSKAFADPKAIEKLFGQNIETKYNMIIDAISSEETKISNEIKISIIQWIFYTKLRSPIWEPFSQAIVGEPRYKKQLHLENFLDEEKFESTLYSFTTDIMNKQWTIYRCSAKEFWWTSDNPGYCLDLNAVKSGVPVLTDPFCRFTGADSLLLYPLSKDYCLAVHAYNAGNPLEFNLLNTPIRFEQADLEFNMLVNLLTLQSRVRLIISSTSESLIYA